MTKSSINSTAEHNTVLNLLRASRKAGDQNTAQSSSFLAKLALKQKNTAGIDLLDDQLLDRATAAKFLGVSPRTLDKWHLLREGPPRISLAGSTGSIRYRVGSIRAWVRSKEADIKPTTQSQSKKRGLK